MHGKELDSFDAVQPCEPRQTLMAIQKNTFVCELALRAGGYQFVLKNDSKTSEMFEEPATLRISISGVRLGADNQLGFVNDCESADPPFFW
jgi:hypothetical protein